MRPLCTEAVGRVTLGVLSARAFRTVESFEGALFVVVVPRPSGSRPAQHAARNDPFVIHTVTDTPEDGSAMPRPNPAQFVYGSATVVVSALAVLLLTGARSGPAVALTALGSLALGLGVALAVPVLRARRARRTAVGRSTVVSGSLPAAQTGAPGAQQAARTPSTEPAGIGSRH
ncbi:hypothetical protein SCA03_54250 [Streptomyces cacaoi]|uniref:Uncharacterized protein n=1 Tax=Streptomyces cacaoi TaxID=1898 RepID=A0A4Y3R5L5_STRCI|nr:hypothetical protein SCA03_54250 [Streptomyces cacaoi]